MIKSAAGIFAAEAVRKSRRKSYGNVDLDILECLWFIIAFLVEQIHDRKTD